MGPHVALWLNQPWSLGLCMQEKCYVLIFSVLIHQDPVTTASPLWCFLWLSLWEVMAPKFFTWIFMTTCKLIPSLFVISSVQFGHLVMSDSLQPHGLQHTRFPCPSPTPRAYSNSCPSSQWCHPAISSSVVPFFSCLQSFPASGSLPMSHFFESGGQSIGASASVAVLPMNIHDSYLLGWTGLISLQSKGLSRAFCNTTVQKHQFFGAQLSLWSNSHIHTWLLEKP